MQQTMGGTAKRVFVLSLPKDQGWMVLPITAKLPLVAWRCHPGRFNVLLHMAEYLQIT